MFSKWTLSFPHDHILALFQVKMWPWRIFMSTWSKRQPQKIEENDLQVHQLNHLAVLLKTLVINQSKIIIRASFTEYLLYARHLHTSSLIFLKILHGWDDHLHLSLVHVGLEVLVWRPGRFCDTSQSNRSNKNKERQVVSDVTNVWDSVDKDLQLPQKNKYSP